MNASTRLTLSAAMLGFAQALSMSSHCSRGRHACVLTDMDMQVLSYGYNGVGSGLPNQCLHPDEPGACGCVHAEANAMAKPRHGSPYYAFITGSPCAQCAQLLVTAGVRRILYLEETSSFHSPLVGGHQVLMRRPHGVLFGTFGSWTADQLAPCGDAPG